MKKINKTSRSSIVNHSMSNEIFQNSESFFDSIIEAVIFYDKDWNYIYVNKAAGTILGKKPQELIGKNAWDVFPDAEKTESGKRYLNAAKKGKITCFESFYTPLQKWFDVQLYPQKDGLVACFHDITSLKEVEQTLKKTEQRLNVALEFGDSGVWEWDLETGSVWYSPSMYNLTGMIKGSPLTAKNTLAYIDRENQEYIAKVLKNKFNKDTDFKYEFRMNHPTLGQRWMESRGEIIRKDKKAIRLIGITVDITDRKQIEEALKESEERFKATFYQSTIPMSLADSQANWLTFNDAYPKMFGYKRNELEGMHPRQLVHPADEKMSRNAFIDLVAGKIPYLTQERRYLHKDGHIIYGLVNATVVRDEKNNPRYVITFIEDITNKKIVEQSLKAREERFRTLIEQSTDVIQLISGEGKILYTSDSIKKVLGYTPEEILGHGGEPYIHPDDAERFYRVFAELVAQPDTSVTLEYRLKHKNGSWVWVEATGSNHLGNPAVQAIVGNFRDITQRKKLEKQKDEFLGIASHELKTPVTSMKAYAQILQRRFLKEGDKKAAEMLGKMDAQINKLTSLIQDLLDVSKVEAGRLKMNNQYFPIDNLVKEIVEEIQRTTETNTMIVRGETKKIVYADKERIGQVITNLLTNAVKYSPDNSHIFITASVKNSDVVISVEDFGIGIPKEHLAHVFDRFFRVSGKTYDTVPGMGLGLNIAAEIIKRHKGNIWVESTIGKGSQFYFTLPFDTKNRDK